ncbi:MAG: hypothetical protein HY754_01195 [Nitrospirae bacterium]|nr:hypothetical protein [Nitrospirota bacterium]
MIIKKDRHFLRFAVPVSIVYIVIGFLIYSDVILNAPFVFDDDDYILLNPLIRDISYFKGLGDLRYVGNLTFALNYAIDGHNPFGYHLFNVIVHLLNSILVYWLVMLTVKTPAFSYQLSAISYQDHEEDKKIGRWEDKNSSTSQLLNFSTSIALFSSLLFLVHPVQTQAVSFVTQRFTSLAALFYMLSVVMYIKFRIHDTKKMHDAGYTIQDKNRESCIVSRVSCIMYLASLFSAVLAMKTKEIAFTLPFTIAIFEFLLIRDSISLRRRLLYLMPYALSLALIPLSLFGPDLGILESKGVSEITRMAKLHEMSDVSPYEYLFTQFRAIAVYIRLLFLPINQKVLYDIKVSHSFFELRVMLSFLLLLSIAGFALYLWRKAKKAEPEYAAACRLVSIGIIWFFLTLSVESSVIPIRDLIFEHRVYLPSVGFIMAFISALFYVPHRVNRAIVRQSDRTSEQSSSFSFLPIALSLYCSVALIVLLSIAAYKRNNIWTDEVLFWTDVVEKLPDKYSFYNDRAMVYLKKKDYRAALRDIKTALRHYSEIATGMIPAGESDFSLKNVAKTYLTRGRIYVQLGKTGQGYSDFEHSLRIMSGSLDLKDIIKQEDSAKLAIPD